MVRALGAAVPSGGLSQRQGLMPADEDAPAGPKGFADATAEIRALSAATPRLRKARCGTCRLTARGRSLGSGDGSGQRNWRPGPGVSRLDTKYHRLFKTAPVGADAKRWQGAFLRASVRRSRRAPKAQT